MGRRGREGMVAEGEVEGRWKGIGEHLIRSW